MLVHFPGGKLLWNLALLNSSLILCAPPAFFSAHTLRVISCATYNLCRQPPIPGRILMPVFTQLGLPHSLGLILHITFSGRSLLNLHAHKVLHVHAFYFVFIGHLFLHSTYHKLKLFQFCQLVFCYLSIFCLPHQCFWLTKAGSMLSDSLLYLLHRAEVLILANNA